MGIQVLSCTWIICCQTLTLKRVCPWTGRGAGKTEALQLGLGQRVVAAPGGTAGQSFWHCHKDLGADEGLRGALGCERERRKGLHEALLQSVIPCRDPRLQKAQPQLVLGGNKAP